MQEDKSTEATSLKESGLRMFRFGEYEEATELFQNAYALYEELGDERGRAEMLNNLGAILTQEEEWDKATEAFNGALAAFQSLEDLDGKAQTLGNLGTMYRYRGDTEAAVEHLKQASDLFHETGDRDKEAATLQLLSRIRLGQARWLEALHFYDLGLACTQPPGIKERFLRRLLQIPYGILSRPQ